MNVDVDVKGAIDALLGLTDRRPGLLAPGGHPLSEHIMVHPDELMAVVELLTAKRPIGCGCLMVKDREGAEHLISNPCGTHGAQRPADFYGDGFWAGFRGGPGIDPDTLDADDRAEWDAGYGAGLCSASPDADEDVRELRPR